MSGHQRVACFLVSGRVDFQALAEACLRFTPLVAVREGEAVFLDLSACSKILPQDFRSRLQVLASRFGCGDRFRVALERDAATALAVAKHGRPLPLIALEVYASPFSVDLEVKREIHEMLRFFEMLGLRSLDDFIKLPSSSLASRFGKRATLLSAQIRGEFTPAWPSFHPASRMIEMSDLGAENLEAFLFILKNLLDRTLSRLRGRSERVTRIQVEAELEKHSAVQNLKRCWQVDFSVPQGSTLGVLPILRDQIAFDLERNSLESPIQTVTLEVLETAPGRGAQRDFFDSKEEESEAWEALLARISRKLGEGRVFVAEPVDRYLPESAYRRSLESRIKKEGAFQAPPERPTRVLSQPERIEKVGNAFHHYNGRHWQIRACRGPERLSSEWWKSGDLSGFNRDYYRVIAESGEHLWVFRNRNARIPDFYLHGFFD